MLVPDECYCLLDLGGRERVEGMRRRGSARDMLCDLLQAVKNHCDGRERNAVQSVE